MDGPFDSGALNRICTNKFKSSSFVSFPNIVIANVQKMGLEIVEVRLNILGDLGGSWKIPTLVYRME